MFTVKTPIQVIRNARAARKARAYDRMIAESQAKIGPYVPANIPVQIYA